MFSSVFRRILAAAILFGCCSAESKNVGAEKPSVKLYRDQFGGMRAIREPVDRYPRLSAEFESQRFLLLSVSDWQPHHSQILVELAQKTAGFVNLLVLCDSFDQMQAATGWLVKVDRKFKHVYFGILDVDTVWVRDFGPVFMEGKEQTIALDFFYEGSRPKDDSLPRRWADNSKTEYRAIQWTLQGGNLLCNGSGLALTTTRIFKDNFITFPNPTPGRDPEIERRRIVIENLVEACNLNDLAILEPLKEEATGHCDMFASFLTEQDVLVARLSQRLDPVNAQILERNVMRLQNLNSESRAIRIHRVDLPPRQGRSWSAYTNAVIANRLVLIPTFDRDPPRLLQAAKSVYQRVLPQHTIETIDMTSMKNLQGELHCLSLHVPAFAPYLKTVYSYIDACQTYYPVSNHANGDD